MRLHPLELRRALTQIALAKPVGRLYGLGPCALIEKTYLKMENCKLQLFQLSHKAQYVRTLGADKTVYVSGWFFKLRY